MLAWLKRDRKPRQGISTSVLPDELVGMSTCVLPNEMVVDILSRLPLKSVCSFKCVCKSWLAFSSDPHYSRKLPRTPAGLLYRKRERGRLSWSPRTAIHLARLPTSYMEIDTKLKFVPPRYKYSKLEGCSNGLLLSYHGRDKSEESFNAIVCNPATQKWSAIPDTEPGPLGSSTHLRLCFDPLWSQQFCIFEFQLISTFGPNTGSATHTTKVKVVFSENSTWSNCLWETELLSVDESLFVNGVLYVRNYCKHNILALDTPDTGAQWLNHRRICLPGIDHMFTGCLGQSSGALCYAKQEIDGWMVRIWSLEGPNIWVVKHCLSMTDVFGRDKFLNSDWRRQFYFLCVEILAFDLEREIVILNDNKANKIVSVSISTGKSSRFPKIPRKFRKLYCNLFYVPYYGEVPALVRS